MAAGEMPASWVARIDPSTATPNDAAVRTLSWRTADAWATNRLGSAFMPLKMGSMLLIVAIFRSGGRPMIGTVIDVGCSWLIGAPLVALVGFLVRPAFPLVFLLIFAEDIVKVTIGIVMFLRRTWIRQLTSALPAEEPMLAETYE